MLRVDGISVSAHPLPDPLLKGIPAQLVAAAAFFRQRALHHPLGGDAGVVFAGQPQGWVAAHSMPANQSVLQAGGKGVAQMQLAGHVGRRHHNAERLPRGVNAGREAPGVPPALINSFFHGPRVVSPGYCIGRLSHCAVPIPTAGVGVAVNPGQGLRLLKIGQKMVASPARNCP